MDVLIRFVAVNFLMYNGGMSGMTAPNTYYYAHP
jgi:hypothetical protein